ncbi:MAG: 2-isopropylmalate synthase [Ruminococcaceae bacterium]|nr:2-isopropylmalate synthase [Oscillospiraceae bacterium]
MEKVRILDTTLRDGEQSPGCSMNIGEKVEIARHLERLGVDVIEAGFPASSPDDLRAVQQISGMIKDAAVCALARCLASDIDLAWEGVRGAVSPRIHVFLATSPIHMQFKLKKEPQEVLAMIREGVTYAKSYCDDVEFSAEDATRSDRKFLAQAFSEAIRAGATVISVADTVGYTTPAEMTALIQYLKKTVVGIGDVTLSVHCHNDLGMAAANTLAALFAGARQAECTINGIGERAGNAALEEVAMSLMTRRDYYHLDCGIRTRQIYRTSHLVQNTTGFFPPPNKAIVGSNAFAHEAGIHQHGVLAARETYEIMTPESVGIPETNMVLGKHSGRHAFEERLASLGYYLNSQELDRAFERFKTLTDKKKVVLDRDLEALISSHITEETGRYALVSFVVNTGNTISTTAVVKLTDGEQEYERAALGEGPVDAAFRAVNKIIGIDFVLESYRLNSVTGGEDALGEAVVRLRKDGDSVSGRGFSTDILEASIKSYLNGANRYLMEHYEKTD